ncbi:MAG TPA: multicopper oxidase domain-containing protein [Steroidobacteraceae bacterium]|nr:multicopper oxidase domain-containing protein [Steroidobacteraceae bacterium]
MRCVRGRAPLLLAIAALCCGPGRAGSASPAPAIVPTVVATAPARECRRPEPAATVVDAPDRRSVNGVLKVELQIDDELEADGSVRYCYSLPDGSQSPTLRVNPGDELVLLLKNNLKELPDTKSADMSARGMAGHGMSGHDMAAMPMAAQSVDPCHSDVMSAVSANLHFHGFTVPAVCHQDDVLDTSVQPTDAPFEYRFKVPLGQPPGLYWYHPHIHGFTGPQVSGGASGALIVEGIERAVPELAGLPERVIVIRDQDLLHPHAAPSANDVAVQALLDRDGDALNTGTGGGRPAKDLSLNFVPVPFPDYPPAKLEMKPNEKQLWRVLNASSVTYLNLAVLYRRGPHYGPQWFGVVAIDGTPISQGGGSNHRTVEWRNSVVISPGSRVEFIMVGPPQGVPGLLVTKAVDTGSTGENDPNRVLASIEAREDAPAPAAVLPKVSTPLPAATLPWIGSVEPVRVRKLYFSEQPLDPANPAGDTDFFLTVDGQTPAKFDMRSRVPNIVAHQGDVEDWIIENRSPELHAFHIHQVHFQVLEWNGLQVNEPFLRDTINVPFQTPGMQGYPSVKIRVDFRDPNAVGLYVYHCHVLDHEDNGMMGLIQVLPAAQSAAADTRNPSVMTH